MGPFNDQQTQGRLWTRTGATIAALVFCVGLVGGMALVVLREIEDLGSSNSDNLQWSLAQADVEYMQFLLALEHAEEDAANIAEVRERFDIFYSRMSILESGRVYQALRESPDFQEPRDHVRGFLARAVPIIDSPDAVLIDRLQDLELAAEELGQDVRSLTLSGLAAFADQADSQREEVMTTLVRLAVVLAVVLVGLMGLALVLWGLNRIASQRAKQVQRTSDRMKIIVETSLDAIVLSDANGRIREFNSSAQKIFGYTREEARQTEMLELLFTRESRELLLEHASRQFEGRLTDAEREKKTLELTAVARGGRTFPAEIAYDRAEGENGLVYVAFIRDISRRKAAEDGLTEARDRALAGERAKAEFLAVMSHEMRTPLNGLLGSMQLMRDEPLNWKQSELLDRMQSSGRLLLGIINDVLDLAKFEAGKLKAERHPMSVSQLLDGVVGTMAPLAADHNSAFSWSWVGKPQDWISGDARRIRQVLLNLAGNAVKFTRDGAVDIEVEMLGYASGGPQIEFRVIDTGIGIAEDDLARIFNDFETLDSSYARQVGGTGLGLGIARRLTGLMQGEIGAESEPGEGSMFWIRFPAPAAEAPKAETADAAPEQRQKIGPMSILMVEDNEINRFVARQMLEAEGHHVTEAVDGQAGVDRAMTERFDAILMDISMPVLDGREATRRIRAGQGASAGAPIVAVTAHALPEEIRQFREAGMTHCISKPLDRTELNDVLAEIAGHDPDVRPLVAGPVEDAEDLLDTDQLARLWGDLPPIARNNLLERFLTEADEGIAWIAAARPDDPDLQGNAHRLAGGCAAFGVRALRLELGELETLLKRGEQPTQEQLDALSLTWSRCRAVLLAWSDSASLQPAGS